MKKKNLIGIFANASTLRNYRKKMRSFIAQGLEDEFTFQFTSNILIILFMMLIIAII